MAEPLTKVKPGDLILAQHLNTLIDFLNGLETRVAMLEAGVLPGVKLTILGLSPSASDVRMGQELRVIGRNFGIPALNVVTIGNATVDTFKAGSNSNLLIFDVPAVSGVPAAGKEVTLTVSGPTGFDSVQLFLRQALPTLPDGTLLVSLKEGPDVPTLTAPGNYPFIFSVRASVNMNESYVVEPQIDSPDTGWAAVMVDDEDVAIEPAEIAINVGTPPVITTVLIRVLVTVPDGATTADLSLRVTSKRNSKLNGASGLTPLEADQAPPQPSDAIVISLAAGNALPPAAVQAGVLTVPDGGTQFAVATFTAIIKTPGSYTVNPLAVDGDPGGLWSTMLGVSDPNFTTATSNAPFSVPVGIKAGTNAPDATLVVSIRSQSDATVVGELRQPIAAT